jgi:hypothetical protein
VARQLRRLAVVLWLLVALVTWNVVFDAHVRGGARAYVDRQEAFTAGKGPRADMDAVMSAAVSSGLWSASSWTAVVLAPLAVVLWRRRRPSRG